VSIFFRAHMSGPGGCHKDPLLWPDAVATEVHPRPRPVTVAWQVVATKTAAASGLATLALTIVLWSTSSSPPTPPVLVVAPRILRPTPSLSPARAQREAVRAALRRDVYSRRHEDSTQAEETSSPEDPAPPTDSIVRASTALGTIVFAVFFFGFIQEKLKEIGQEPEQVVNKPEDVLLAMEKALVRKLQAKAKVTASVPPHTASAAVRLESDACGMRQPGKGGECLPQDWRGPKYSNMDCGEDSFVLSPNLLGVADGVGAWREEGIDPSIFANQLMCNVKELTEHPEGAPEPHVDGAAEFQGHPAMIMHQAYSKAMLEGKVPAGSATCCLGQLQPSGLLRVVNVGDSGLLVIRNGKCVFHSATQQFRFNAPYQLGIPVESMTSDGAVEEVHTCAGDGIVVATDGVFDNLFDEEIAAIYEENKHHSAEDIANLIQKRALAVSTDKTKETPFSLSCKKVRYKWSGGKGDDISVVVGKVLPA